MAVIARKNPLDSMVASLKVVPPALTGGLLIFMTILFFVGVFVPGFNDSLKLQRSTFANFELNRLTFYPMLHLSLLHLAMNGWMLLPLLSAFELQNGTVRTGIVLNALGTVTGVAYVLLSFVFFPNSAVLGSSAWVFSLLAYFSYQESKHTPYITVSQRIRIPTVAKPVILLMLTAILVPGSSIIGHFLGVIAGWLLALGKLRFMTDPPSKLVLFIESKLSRLISLIPSQIQYIREAEAIELRKSTTQPGGGLLPLANLSSTSSLAPAGGPLAGLPSTSLPRLNPIRTGGSEPVRTGSISVADGGALPSQPPATGSSGILSPIPVSVVPLSDAIEATAGAFKGEGHSLGDEAV